MKRVLSSKYFVVFFLLFHHYDTFCGKQEYRFMGVPFSKNERRGVIATFLLMTLFISVAVIRDYQKTQEKQEEEQKEHQEKAMAERSEFFTFSCYTPSINNNHENNSLGEDSNKKFIKSSVLSILKSIGRCRKFRSFSFINNKPVSSDNNNPKLSKQQQSPAQQDVSLLKKSTIFIKDRLAKASKIFSKKSNALECAAMESTVNDCTISQQCVDFRPTEKNNQSDRSKQGEQALLKENPSDDQYYYFCCCKNFLEQCDPTKKKQVQEENSSFQRIGENAENQDDFPCHNQSFIGNYAYKIKKTILNGIIENSYFLTALKEKEFSYFMNGLGKNSATEAMQVVHVMETPLFVNYHYDAEKGHPHMISKNYVKREQSQEKLISQENLIEKPKNDNLLDTPFTLQEKVIEFTNNDLLTVISAVGATDRAHTTQEHVTTMMQLILCAAIKNGCDVVVIPPIGMGVFKGGIKDTSWYLTGLVNAVTSLNNKNIPVPYILFMYFGENKYPDGELENDYNIKLVFEHDAFALAAALRSENISTALVNASAADVLQGHCPMGKALEHFNRQDPQVEQTLSKITAMGLCQTKKSPKNTNVYRMKLKEDEVNPLSQQNGDPLLQQKLDQ